MITTIAELLGGEDCSEIPLLQLFTLGYHHEFSNFNKGAVPTAYLKKMFKSILASCSTEQTVSYTRQLTIVLHPERKNQEKSVAFISSLYTLLQVTASLAENCLSGESKQMSGLFQLSLRSY